MKINEEILEVYRSLLKEISNRDIPDEEVATYVEIKLLADLVMSLDQVDAPETVKQLKAFAAKELNKDAELEAFEPENELTDEEES